MLCHVDILDTAFYMLYIVISLKLLVIVIIIRTIMFYFLYRHSILSPLVLLHIIKLHVLVSLKKIILLYYFCIYVWIFSLSAYFSIKFYYEVLLL